MISRNSKTTAYIPIGLNDLLYGLLKEGKVNNTFKSRAEQNFPSRT